ncbi:MAG: hypothetical protein V4488_16715 [Pseudomonadota bacterium]
MELNSLMVRFRLASRELFNHYFHASTHDEDEWVTEERFSIVEEHLFSALVTEPANLPYVPYGQLQANILVTLRSGEFAPWMLNRENNSGYWDHPQSEFTKDAVLHFMNFFDWDVVDFKDGRYVRVVVASWPSFPEHIGRQALVESQYVQFIRGYPLATSNA